MTLSNLPPLVTVFGGSGFVGRSIVRALAKRGYRIRVAVRRPDLAGFLQPMGNVGQISLVQANLRYRASVDAAVAGATHVVNCVGILHEAGRNTFDAVQEFGARAVAEAARAAGATLTHISAIGADASSQSSYARTKGRAEAAVLAIKPDAVILRPSVVFGQDDSFFNKFGRMSQTMPFLPLIGGGKTKFQPVFVEDVAEAAVRAVDGKLTPGAVYELQGVSGDRAAGGRSPQAAGADALRHRLADRLHRLAGALRAAAADGGPGDAAEVRQHRLEAGDRGWPHACRHGHRADHGRHRAADLHGTVSPAGPVPPLRPGGLSVSKTVLYYESL